MCLICASSPAPVPSPAPSLTPGSQSQPLNGWSMLSHSVGVRCVQYCQHYELRETCTSSVKTDSLDILTIQIEAVSIEYVQTAPRFIGSENLGGFSQGQQKAHL